MRVLIVGCGYVGLPLGARLVRDGHEVFGLRRNPAAEPGLREAGIRPLFADITRPGELEKLTGGFDWVVHCVAAGGDLESYREIYFEGTTRLLDWLAKDPPRKLVYTSSTSVYGQNDGSVVTEISLAEPEADTAKVLREAENLLLDAAAQKHFPAVILRVAGIYGPGRRYLLKQFLRGEARVEGDGSRFLNMIHRDDLMGVILAALERGTSGEIYNAADNAPVTQLNFFEWLAARLKQPLPPVVAADATAMRKRGLTNKRVSNAKLRAELKYEFKFSDFRAGYAAEIACPTA